MLTLIIASAVLTAASLTDGVSTVHFLKSPDYTETNPLFGERPSTARVYGEGAAIIGSEVLLAFALAHAWSPLGWIFVAGFAVQSAIHFRNAKQNFAIKV